MADRFQDMTPLPVQLPSTSPIGAVQVELRRLSDADLKRVGATQMLARVWAAIGALVTAGLIALAGWVWTMQANATEAHLETHQNGTRIQEHADRGGPEGHPDSVVRRTTINEGRIESINHQLTALQTSLEQARTERQEILRRLPNRGR